jgi:hypothetical protein
MNRFLKYWRRGDRGEDFGTHSQPLSTATHTALHNPITLAGLRRPKNRASLTDPSR